MVIEVFRTNIPDAVVAGSIASQLHQQFPGIKVNFDLEDCDKIMRTESMMDLASCIRELVVKLGYCCDVLE